MAKITPQEASQKWANNLGSATTQIEKGIRALTVSPTQSAKAKKAKLVQNWNASITNGKWEAGLDRVTLPDWQQAAIVKGIPRIGQGAQAAQSKMTDYYNRLFPYQDNLVKQIQQMPDITLDNNIARMVAFTKGMAAMPKR